MPFQFNHFICLNVTKDASRWMDDMCQKTINTLWVAKNQPSLAHVTCITKSQPSLT
jgi:hypothetical protein